MSRERYEVKEGDKIWPIIQTVRNTHYDDLTEARVQEIVALIDSWRITDAEGKRIERCNCGSVFPNDSHYSACPAARPRNP